MNLRKYKLSPADLAEAKASLFYQPFRISEEIQSGIAYDWIYNKGVFQVDRREVDAETWKTFDALNHNLRTTYDGWLDAIAAGYGDLRNASVLDVACAEGYFLHGLKQRGAGPASATTLRPVRASLPASSTGCSAMTSNSGTLLTTCGFIWSPVPNPPTSSYRRPSWCI